LALPHTGRHLLSQMSRNFDFFADELLDRYYMENIFQGDGGGNARLAADRQLFGNNALYRAFKGSIPVLDDRGLIFIRHGEPDKSARTTGGAALELWLYELPDGPMLLSFKEEDFDGQIGASVLVPTLMGASPLLRQQICHLDTRLCPMSNDPTSTSITMTGEGFGGNSIRSGQPARQASEVQRLSGGGALARAQAEGERAMIAATSTDGYRRRFSGELATRAVFHGLAREGGNTVLLVPFAIPGEKLTGIPIGNDGRTGYRVRFVIQAVRQGDGLLRSVDTLRGLATPRRLGAGEYLTGVMEMPVPPGVYTASLMTSQDETGSVSSISSVAVPAPARRAISDLVLGRERSGANWNSGTQMVPANPLGAWRRDEDVEVYFQLLGVPAGEQFSMRFEFWSVDRERRDAEVTVKFDESSSGLRHEVRRSLRLRDLDPGRWRLRVVVNPGPGELVTEGRVTVAR
ncbi:MAG TPA: hypothetical protein PLL69_03735, partial [Gemmatimonadales bacterium]|nr:hypothetical protein [Gemmatimonadales bacterium]